MTAIDGVEFDAAHARKWVVQIAGVELPVIHLDDFIANKKASGRLKDLADIEALVPRPGSLKPARQRPSSPTARPSPRSFSRCAAQRAQRHRMQLLRHVVVDLREQRLLRAPAPQRLQRGDHLRLALQPVRHDRLERPRGSAIRKPWPGASHSRSLVPAASAATRGRPPCRRRAG